MSLRDYRNRIQRIAKNTPAANSGGSIQLGPRAREIMELDKDIARLEREIAETRREQDAAEALMTPEERAVSRRERERERERTEKELRELTDGLSIDEAIAVLEEEVRKTKEEIALRNDSGYNKGGGGDA